MRCTPRAPGTCDLESSGCPAHRSRCTSARRPDARRGGSCGTPAHLCDGRLGRAETPRAAPAEPVALSRRARGTPARARTSIGELSSMRDARLVSGRRSADRRGQGVLDFVVAAGAIDRLLRDIRGVDAREVSLALELLGLIVARDAALPRCFALPVDHVPVAALAGDASTHELAVIEPHRADRNVARRHCVAAGASGDRRQLAVTLHALEVTGEAGTPFDLEVLVHDDLRMTARAAQLPPCLRRLEMRAVIESDSARQRERALALELAHGVAARAEAARVLDIGGRLGAVRTAGPLPDLRYGLELDAEGIAEPRRIVTLDTGDFTVLGDLPRLHVRPHDVARVTELRARADVPESGAGRAADHHES